MEELQKFMEQFLRSTTGRESYEAVERRYKEFLASSRPELQGVNVDEFDIDWDVLEQVDPGARQMFDNFANQVVTQEAEKYATGASGAYQEERLREIAQRQIENTGSVSPTMQTALQRARELNVSNVPGRVLPEEEFAGMQLPEVQNQSWGERFRRFEGPGGVRMGFNPQLFGQKAVQHLSSAATSLPGMLARDEAPQTGEGVIANPVSRVLQALHSTVGVPLRAVNERMPEALSIQPDLLRESVEGMAPSEVEGFDNKVSGFTGAVAGEAVPFALGMAPGIAAARIAGSTAPGQIARGMTRSAFPSVAPRAGDSILQAGARAAVRGIPGEAAGLATAVPAIYADEIGQGEFNLDAPTMALMVALGAAGRGVEGSGLLGRGRQFNRQAQSEANIRNAAHAQESAANATAQYGDLSDPTFIRRGLEDPPSVQRAKAAAAQAAERQRLAGIEGSREFVGPSRPAELSPDFVGPMRPDDAVLEALRTAGHPNQSASAFPSIRDRVAQTARQVDDAYGQANRAKAEALRIKVQDEIGELTRQLEDATSRTTSYTPEYKGPTILDSAGNPIERAPIGSLEDIGVITNLTDRIAQLRTVLKQAEEAAGLGVGKGGSSPREAPFRGSSPISDLDFPEYKGGPQRPRRKGAAAKKRYPPKQDPRPLGG